MLYEFVQCLGLIESCHRQDTASTPLGTVAARACCALATSNRPQRQQSLWQKPRPTVDLIIQPVATWGLKNRPQGSIGKRSQNWLAKEKPAALCRNEEQPSEKKSRLWSWARSDFRPSTPRRPWSNLETVATSRFECCWPSWRCPAIPTIPILLPNDYLIIW